MDGYELFDYVIDKLKQHYPAIEYVMCYRTLYPNEKYYELYILIPCTLYYTLYDSGRKFTESDGDILVQIIQRDIERGNKNNAII